MAALRALGAGVGLALVAQAAVAQPPATTVQLPTFSQFTVRTTVSVPDGGTAVLGGIDRAVDSSVTRGLGPLRSRGFSSGRSASGVSVSATIIDHAEIDRAILAAAAAERTTPSPMAAKAREIAQGLPALQSTGERSMARALSGSVAAIRAQAAAQEQQQADELAEYINKAQQAEAAGKTGVAKVYYQLVARSTSPQRQLAAERLAALSKNATTK